MMLESHLYYRQDQVANTFKKTFGTFIDITDVPSSGNSPHHLGPSVDGQLLVGGGLLSLLKTQDTAFYFDTSDPYHPKFSHSNRGLLGSIVDEIRAKPEGYVISCVCRTVSNHWRQWLLHHLHG